MNTVEDNYAWEVCSYCGDEYLLLDSYECDCREVFCKEDCLVDHFSVCSLNEEE